MFSLKFIVIVLLTCFSSLRCDYFTALVDLEKLLHTEKELTTILAQYLWSEERRLQKIKRLHAQFTEFHEGAEPNVDTFLSNPVNAFLLIKRLTRDWEAGERLAQVITSKNIIENIQLRRKDLHFPKEEDLNGAAVALIRLQDTYELNTTTLARGLIEGTKPSQAMTANDCYELGIQAYNGKDYRHTMLWMQEAMDRLHYEAVRTADYLLIMEYIAFCAYTEGNFRRAVDMTENILQSVPNHQRALYNLDFYQHAITHPENFNKEDMKPKAPIYVEETQQSLYEKLCRGESVETKVKEVLSCRYFTNNNPSLILQPVKEEELCLEPRVVTYHDILSEKEINLIKQLAQPHLKRALIRNDNNQSQITSVRTSKSAWLQDSENLVVARISQRIEDITGLDMSVAEALQVGNYGIGGHYVPHFDFFSDSAMHAIEHGNRIATWLNYMSDVDAGGATVFPKLGIRVKPRKGSASFWYNLLRSGTPDNRTLHAACPVLAGNKWVSNKWIHESGQQFRRRCSLNEFE